MSASLLEHLSHFDEKARTHPSYKYALILPPRPIDQRIAILKAAQWLIDLIEMSSRIDHYPGPRPGAVSGRGHATDLAPAS